MGTIMLSEQRQAAWNVIGERRERRDLVSQYALGDPVLGLGFDQLDAVDWSVAEAPSGPDDGALVSAEVKVSLMSAIAAWFVGAAMSGLLVCGRRPSEQRPSIRHLQ